MIFRRVEDPHGNRVHEGGFVPMAVLDSYRIDQETTRDAMHLTAQAEVPRSGTEADEVRYPALTGDRWSPVCGYAVSWALLGGALQDRVHLADVPL